MLDFKDAQNGHYIPRNRLNTRFDERNNNCQCVWCNVFKKWNYPEYAARLTHKFWNWILDELNSLKNIDIKLSRDEYSFLITYYECLIWYMEQWIPLNMTPRTFTEVLSLMKTI